MNINEKIDLLMRLTKTTNSAMARFAAMDASHLSRLRRGERSISANAAYLSRMAIYFARHCKDEYQLRTLAELIRVPFEVAESRDNLAEAIEIWLSQEEKAGGAAVGQFLAGIGGKPPEVTAWATGGSSLVREEECWCEREENSCRLLYGNHGKREAVRCFLESVLRSPNPTELLLFSDEDMDWLTEDRRFTQQWAGLMMKIGAAGHKITMIHTVSRNLDEMLTAIGQWMPLYMTGAIQPYYFPKKRDGIFKRTLYAAPGIAAVTSSSVIRANKESMVHYLTDEKAIESVTQEFRQYFSLCRPLMKIFMEEEYSSHLEALVEFEKEEANSLIVTASLSAGTIPEEVLLSLFSPMDMPDKEGILKRMMDRQRVFLDNLRKTHCTEIIRLANMEEILAGKALVSFSNMFGLGEIYYTKDEYRRHLALLIELMESNQNYQICLSDSKEDSQFMIYGKEDLGAMVVRIGRPFVAFVLNEGNMAAAFWDYLRNKAAECLLSREEVLEYLKEFEKRIGEEE